MDYIANINKFILRLSYILDFQIVIMLLSADHAWANMILTTMLTTIVVRCLLNSLHGNIVTSKEVSHYNLLENHFLANIS